MLSATNSVTDIKNLIIRTYDQLGFASDAAYVTFINLRGELVYADTFLPLVGEAWYTVVQAKDKVSLEDRETWLYWAEVNLVCAKVMSDLGRQAVQKVKGSGQSFSSEGYSQSIQNARDPGYNTAAFEFWNEGERYLGLAGYTNLRAKRGGSFWNPEERDIWTVIT